MPEQPSEYAAFLRPGNIVHIGVDLPDKTFAEDVATVICTDNGEIRLQLCGSGFPRHLPIISGSKILISKGEGRTLFHCTTQLKDASSEGALRIELPKKVVVSERCEQTREDVTVPVKYYLPKSQNMGRVISEWESLRGCQGGCIDEAAPILSGRKSLVNFSGNGLRFKISDCLSYGTLLHLNIELPGKNAEHIHAIGSIVRTKELLEEMNRVAYYSTSMSFKMIASSDRQRLIKHILAEQRRSLLEKKRSDSELGSRS